ncbi:MAG: ArnT family glycosyltransferase [Haloarculaceae archaeon]
MRSRTARRTTAAVALCGALAVAVVSTHVFPYHSLNHDEGVYLEQAAMVLHGQLFLHPPIEGVFRPWFFVARGDLLYPKYAPVPAAMFALGKLLGAYWLALSGIAAGVLALVAGVVREVFDRPAGVLAAAFVLASPLFLLDSSVFLPYAPTTLLNLAFAYAYLRADREHDRRWAALAGSAAGLAFFARPYTAVLFATPFVGHALWTLHADGRQALVRQGVTAALGLAGVGVALAYNAVVTGSPWVFPYLAFAPRDGLGFGTHRILNHEVAYTVDLALRANRRVVALLFTKWVAGGLLGTALAVAGLARVARRRPTARELALAGLFPSIVVGNVFFWGNYNVLGVLDRPGDGLVAVLGPYYHFDLLVPTAAFAVVGACWGGRTLRRALAGRRAQTNRHPLSGRLDGQATRVAMALVLVASVVAFGGVTARNLDDPVERNLDATATYRTVYEPFDDGPPANAVVLLPGPYGDWLNHPFQALRNDPGFDGRTVYAVDDRPFAIADAFPNRTLYRYVYRGAWAPTEGSPTAARLRRVRDVSGDAVRLDATVGVPGGADRVTVRVATDEGSAYYVARDVSDALDVRLTVADGQVRVGGDVRAVANRTLAVDGRDDVRLTAFVDYGAGGGFTYRLDLPVDASGKRVRALSPRVERCRVARNCGGAAAYLPETAPDGVFVRTDLAAVEFDIRD